MLEEFLSQNKGKTLEFKENTNNLKGIINSIIAFANTAQGVILIGVKNHSKEIIGLENPLLEEEKIAKCGYTLKCRHNFKNFSSYYFH